MHPDRRFRYYDALALVVLFVEVVILLSLALLMLGVDITFV